MYRAFFDLRDAPFRITPDPRFLHHDPAVDAALNAIATGISERAGLLLLVGEVGTGKTTLVRQLLETLPESVRTVLVLHPTVGVDEILDHVLLELGLPVTGGDRAVLLERLADFLREHARDGDVAIFFDEAQALRESTLAALPDLLALVTDRGRPALQLVLAGQPELESRLAAPDLADVQARVAVTAHLAPLTPDRVAAYVRARLERAGARDPDLFDDDALEQIAIVSQGVPRLINVLCENALMTAFVEGQHRITRPIIDAVWADYAPLHHPEGTPMPAPPDELALAAEAEAGQPPTRSRRARLVLAAAGVAVAAVLLVLAVQPWRSPPPSPAPAPQAMPETLAEAPPPTPETAEAPAPETSPSPEAAAPARAGPPSAVDAVALVDRFWRAYEARDARALRALFADDAAPAGKILDVDPTGRGALVAPAARIEAKPVGDRVTVRVPFVLNTQDDRGRAIRRQGVATWQIAMRDGAPRIVSLAAESSPAPRP